MTARDDGEAALVEAMARAIVPDAFDTADLDALAHNSSAWSMLADHYAMIQEKAHDEARAALTALRALLAERPALAAHVMPGWQPIETAPRDGTHFLAYEPTGDMYRAAYHSHGYVMAFGGQPVVKPPEPTHWMLVPPSPTASAAEAEGREG